MSLSRHQAVGAYRRWEPPEFDAEGRVRPPRPASETTEPPGTPEPPRTVEPPPPQPEPPEPPVKLPTADEIEAMFEQARVEGHGVGLQEGYAAGRAEGEARVREEASRLAALAVGLDDALSRLDQDVAEEVVALAVELARRIVHDTLHERPNVIAGTVREALHQLPQHHVRIHLHPDDAVLVREHLADPLEHGQHRIVEDVSLTRGGCRLQAAGSEVDGTLETRWRRVLEGLGRADPARDES